MKRNKLQCEIYNMIQFLQENLRNVWKAIYQNMNCGGNIGDFIYFSV